LAVVLLVVVVQVVQETHLLAVVLVDIFTILQYFYQ
jgi:hypothetical protein